MFTNSFPYKICSQFSSGSGKQLPLWKHDFEIKVEMKIEPHGSMISRQKGSRAASSSRRLRARLTCIASSHLAACRVDSTLICKAHVLVSRMAAAVRHNLCGLRTASVPQAFTDPFLTSALPIQLAPDRHSPRTSPRNQDLEVSQMQVLAMWSKFCMRTPDRQPEQYNVCTMDTTIRALIEAGGSS